MYESKWRKKGKGLNYRDNIKSWMCEMNVVPANSFE